MAAEAFSKIMELIFTEGFDTVYPEGLPPAGKDSGDAVCSSESDSAEPDSAEPGNAGPAHLDFFTIPDDPRQLLSRIGYHMGKWIYLIDAADDIEENILSGAYNPLLFRFSYDKDAETTEKFRRRIEPNLRFNLYHYLAELSNYTDSLDIKKNKGIIDNVIYLGLNRKTEEIISRVDKDKQI